MIGAAIIVFREIIEAGLIVGIVLAAAACVLVAAGQDVAARFPPEGEDRQERG